MKKFIITTCFAAVAWVIGWLIERRLMRGYWSRVCTGAHWRRRFPHTSKADIREFLRTFVDAFGFSRSRRLRFTPDDRVMDVYRTLHPPKWTLADSMELESLALSFHKDYGIDLVPLWREDITLGELFALTRPKSDKPSPGGNAAPPRASA